MLIVNVNVISFMCLLMCVSICGVSFCFYFFSSDEILAFGELFQSISLNVRMYEQDMQMWTNI